MSWLSLCLPDYIPNFANFKNNITQHLVGKLQCVWSGGGGWGTRRQRSTHFIVERLPPLMTSLHCVHQALTVIVSIERKNKKFTITCFSSLVLSKSAGIPRDDILRRQDVA